MRISTRGTVDAFIALQVMEAANHAEAGSADIVRMEIGQPGAPAPRAAREAAAAAMASGALGYTPALGLPELRARIARRYADRHGVDVSPRRIAVTTGASGGFLLAALALFDAGERVAACEPGYPGYRNMLRALGLSPVRLAVGSAGGWAPDARALADAGRGGRVAGLIAASPANPTGRALNRAELADLIEECQRIGAAFVCDELYHGIEYAGPAPSALEVSAEVVVLNSFSKYFAMTGWRVGWMVAPEPVIEAVERLAQNLAICPPHVGQVAALAALDAEAELDAHVSGYAANRDLLLNELPRAGFGEIARCDGAFYLWVDVSRLTDDSAAFCARMLAEAGVAATPGVDFDPVEGRRRVRFSFAGPQPRIAEGVRRLRAWLGGG